MAVNQLHPTPRRPSERVWLRPESVTGLGIFPLHPQLTPATEEFYGDTRLNQTKPEFSSTL